MNAQCWYYLSQYGQSSVSYLLLIVLHKEWDDHQHHKDLSSGDYERFYQILEQPFM